MERRSFLRDASFGAAALAVGRAGAAAERKLDAVGLQLLTVAKEMKADWQSTLKAVAAMGYRYIESGGHLGPSRESYLAFLKQLGLSPLGGGGAMAEFRKSTEAQIEAAIGLGKTYVICYWPWAEAVEKPSLDDWKRVADELNAIGAKVKKAGLTFAYHNHDIEFREAEGRIPYDVILESTDPSSVVMQMDVYWVEKGGGQPVSYFEKHQGRFPIWHVKDMAAGAEKTFACVGQGVLDFAAYFAKADVAGMKHIVVEHDKPEDGLACAKTGLEFLRNLRY